MASENKFWVGFFLFVVLTSSVYILLPNTLRIDIQNTKTIFQVYENDSWIKSGTEYTKIYDGSSLMRANSRSINYTVEENKTFVQRTSTFKDGIVVYDFYEFDGTTKIVENYPINHEVKIINGNGKILQYEINDILYEGETQEIASPFIFGHNMKVEWEDGSYYSKVIQQKVASDKIIIKYKISSNEFSKKIKLFDPSTGYVTPTNVADYAYFTNPSNVLSEDGSVGYATGSGGGVCVDTFGISIPEGSTILGVEIQVKGMIFSGADNVYVQLFDSVAGGDQHLIAFPSTSLSWVSTGNDTDLWGVTLTEAKVENTLFGVCLNTYGSEDPEIDAVRMNITYSLPTYSLNITSPTTESPQSVSSGENISIVFDFVRDLTTNITSGVTIDNITIGGEEASVISSGSALTSYEIFYDGFETGEGWYYDTSGGCSNTNPCGAYGKDGWTDCDDRTDDYIWCASSDTSLPNAVYSGSYGLITGDWDGGGVTNTDGLWFTFDPATACNSGPCDYITVSLAYAQNGMDSGEYCWITEQADSGTPSSLLQFGNEIGTDTWQTGSFNLSSGTLSASSAKVRIMCDMSTSTDIGIFDDFNITGYAGGISTEFDYISGVGWMANVTVPTFVSGLKDLFVSAIYSGSYANDTQTEAIDYGGGVGDSCTYSSGNWLIEASDNCVISSPVDVGGNNVVVNGTGTLTLTANIYNYGIVLMQGQDSSNKAEVFCVGGCFA